MQALYEIILDNYENLWQISVNELFSINVYMLVLAKNTKFVYLLSNNIWDNRLLKTKFGKNYRS